MGPSASSSSATWVIGDVHGCHQTLTNLLDRAGIDLARDRLVLVGDLVNRGPRSLEVLRWARERKRQMGARFDCVLGNHDLHLLAVARGLRRRRASDRLDDVLDAPDRDELIPWLQRRPLALEVAEALVVHAGVRASWSMEETLERARALETWLQGKKADRLLAALDGRADVDRSKKLARARRDLETLTRVRMLDEHGAASRYSGPPAEAPPGLVPWFEVPGRLTADTTVVFGHWAALGLYVGPRLYGLDSGCAWGRQLTALRLEDGKLVQENVADDEARPTRERRRGAS